MKLTYQAPAIDTTKFAPEILDGPYHTSAGTKGTVTGGSNNPEDTNLPDWGFGGNGETGQSVDSKQDLWDDWDD